MIARTGLLVGAQGEAAMKTILLHVHGDEAAEARLQVALDLTRAHEGHLACVQITPLTSYVGTDMFGGVYVLTDVLDAVRKNEEKVRAETEARLSRENVPWTYEHLDGDPATMIVARSRLADAVVLSRSLGEFRIGDPMPLAGDVALHARTPVIAVPPDARGFTKTDRAFVAWNGSAESAYALKCAMPLLRQASEIHVVTVANGDNSAFAAADAGEYLSRHGLKAELHEVDRGATVADRLLEALNQIGGDYMVMGAYGHSRAREFILGGVTRTMLQHCPVPLLLAH